MSDLVSILIPAYNAERYLAEALDSALAQTWPNKEIIVVDDGSTDASLEIARTYVSQGVTVLTQRNRGASAARNRALQLAKGDYIQWLDADDILAPDKVSAQLRDAPGGRSSRLLLAASFGEFCKDPRRATFAPTALWRDLAPVDYFLGKFMQHAWLFPAAWLVSRELTERAGHWDESLSLDDDGEYFARLVAASQGVRFVADAKAYYRQASTGSLSRSISEPAAGSLLTSIQLCIGYLLALEDSNRTRAASIRFLQDWIDRGNCFHPDRAELFSRIRCLASELGGTVRAPRLDWRYEAVRGLFGWAAVRRLRGLASNTRVRARVELERFEASFPLAGKARRPASEAAR